MRLLGEGDYGGIFNSWALEIGIEGLSTGGEYDLGLGKNCNPTNAKLVGHLQAWEFDKELKPAHTLAMTLYGVKRLRKPYPDHEKAYETPATVAADGYDGVKIIVSLSEYIFRGDSLSVTLLPGLYTQNGVVSAAVTKFPVTNLSTLTCPKVVGNWSWPDHQRFSGDMTLRAVGFHGYSMNGKPVQRIRFSVTDTAIPPHTVTTDVQEATIDKTMPDANPVIEYVGKFTSEQLRKGQLADGPVVCNFAAYPCRTDVQGSGILNTADGVNQGVTWKYAPQRNYYDSAGKYGVVYAVVDPEKGNDTNGVAAAEQAEAEKAPYATISKAAAGIVTFNKARPEPYQRNNASGGLIYLRKGTFAIGEKRPYASGSPEKYDVALELKPYPGVTREETIIGIDPGIDRYSRMMSEGFIRFSHVTFKHTGEAWWMLGRKKADTLWLDQCRIDITAATNSAGSFYNFERALMTQSEWLCGPGNSGLPTFALLRGNVIRGGGDIGVVRTTLGNTAICGVDKKANACRGSEDGFVYAFNRMLDQREGDNLGFNGVAVHGIAIVQNLFERAKQGGGNTPIMMIAAFLKPASNVIYYHNTVLGERVNMAYNDTGDQPVLRRFWFERNNIFHVRAMKSDIFEKGNGNRTGNWAPGFGVAMCGNINSLLWTTDAKSDHLDRWGGYSVHGGHGLNAVLMDPSQQTKAFVDFKAQSKGAANDGAGNGNYHLTGNSAATGLALQWVLPYDLDGKSRKANGAAGAYEFNGDKQHKKE